MSLSALPWILCGILTMLFAALAPLLAKAGMRRTDADAAGAWRGLSFLIALLLLQLLRPSPLSEDFSSFSIVWQWIFLCLAILCAGGAWLFYHNALKEGSAVRSAAMVRFSQIPAFLLSLWLLHDSGFSLFTLSGALRAAAMLLFLCGTLLLCPEESGKWLRSALFAMLLAVGAIFFFRCTPLSALSYGGVALCALTFAAFSGIVVLVRGKRSLALDIRLRDFLLLLLSAFAGAAAVYCFERARAGSLLFARLLLHSSLLLLSPLCFLALKERPTKTQVIALLLLCAGMLLQTVPSLL